MQVHLETVNREPQVLPAMYESKVEYRTAPPYQVRSNSFLAGGSQMNQEPIRTDRETLRSLPKWYQALAEVLKEKGRLVLIDEKPLSED